MTLATVLLCVLAQEPKVNPRFEFWSDCKVGSWVKLRMLVKAGEMDIATEIVHTLKEVTAEKLIIETATTTKMGDREMKMPPKKEEITPKIDPAQTMKPAGESDEEITVAGKALKCRVYEWESEAGGKKVKGKAWTSKLVPGGVARSEFTSEKAPAPMKMEAVEWEKK